MAVIEKNLEMGNPASYRIVVQGDLDPSWSDRLGGMVIEHQESETGAVRTVLTGKLADQAALSGVLNALYGLRLPVLSADCTETD